MVESARSDVSYRGREMPEWLVANRKVSRTRYLRRLSQVVLNDALLFFQVATFAE